MPSSIRPVRVNHLNVVLEDFDASIAHVRNVYGAQFMVDMPQTEMHAGLFEIGRAMQFGAAW